jgi:hypothetical protein
VRLLIPPGSLLLESPALRPHLGPLIADAFHYHWTHPDPRMDKLHAAVSALFTAEAQGTDDAAATFRRIADLADGLWESDSDGPIGGDAPHGGRATLATATAPRLTEPWFC